MFSVDLSRSPHFKEICKGLNDAIASDDRLANVFRKNPIIIGAQKASYEDIQNLPYKIKIGYNLEQIESSSLWPQGEYIGRLLQFDLNVDYARQNRLFLRRDFGRRSLGLNVPPIFTEEPLHRLTDRPVDVCFIGAKSPRRLLLWDQLTKQGFTTFWLNEEFGDRRDALLRNSKIVLNIRHNDDGLFETPRAELALASGCVFISESARNFTDIQKQYDTVDHAPYELLIQTINQRIGSIYDGSFDEDKYRQKKEESVRYRGDIFRNQLKIIARVVQKIDTENFRTRNRLNDKVVDGCIKNDCCEFLLTNNTIASQRTFEEALQYCDRSGGPQRENAIERLLSIASIIFKSKLSRFDYFVFLAEISRQRGYDYAAVSILLVALDKCHNIVFSRAKLENFCKISCALPKGILQVSPPVVRLFNESKIVSDLSVQIIVNTIREHANRDALAIVAERFECLGGMGMAIAARLNWYSERNVLAVDQMSRFIAWAAENKVRGWQEFISDFCRM